MKAFSIKPSRKTMMSYMGMSFGLFAMSVMLCTSGVVNFGLIVLVLALSVLALSVMYTRLRCDVDNDIIYREFMLLGYAVHFEKIQLKETSELHFYFENVPVRSGGIREVARFVVRDKRDLMMQDEITLAFATEPGVVNVLVRIIDKVSDLYGRPVNDGVGPDEPELVEEIIADEPNLAQEQVK